ncbi:hypothetical protein L6R52_02075 [Myxococcota bacterium]|nr:hypothetical protein [Myxococcota bacterium]
MSRSSAVAAAFVVAFTAACGSEGGSSTADSGVVVDTGAVIDSGVPDSGVEDAGGVEDAALVDAGPSCPPPSRLDESDGKCRATITAWTESTPLPQGLDHHGTVIAAGGSGTHLHVIGGNDYRRTYAEVHSAPIAEDGSIGAWITGPLLPETRSGMGVVAVDAFVVVAGGRVRVGRDLSEVLVARIGASGILGDWQPAPRLPSTAFHLALVAHGDRLVVTGGLLGSTATTAVYGARISVDGAVSEWSRLRDLPEPRSHHGAVVHAGAIYLAGGLAGNPAASPTLHRDVLRAELLADGSLGEWVTVGALPENHATHSAVVVGDELWLLGGVEENATFSDDILAATFADDGTLGEFRVLGRLPRGRGHVHQTPVHRGKLYSVGGSANRVLSSAADVATLE